MAKQILTLSIVASETNTEAIQELIKDCEIASISGTVNTKYRDYSAENILEELYANGIEVQKAEHCEDDGASMLEITMYVPDEQKIRIKALLLDFETTEEDWGSSVEDQVYVETKDGVLDIEFSGRIIGFKGPFAQVVDMEDNVFDVPCLDVTPL